MLANPYVLLAIALFYVGSLGAVGYKAYETGIEHQLASEKKDREAYEKGRDAALEAAATAIAKIDVKQVTIRQRAETITREVPVYTDCHNTADAMRVLNDALAAPGKEQPADNGKLPGAGPAR